MCLPSQYVVVAHCSSLADAVVHHEVLQDCEREHGPWSLATRRIQFHFKELKIAVLGGGACTVLYGDLVNSGNINNGENGIRMA